ncbi:hypothetical protein EVJ58_g284 [Rhodofomes roseus]|uniref:P-loop containing nucleoside triphosphate hydrolase protein n=1 Tax=Rhodofomes roseus TaxID=34475 RepID=A0A4Y9Z523_9APHY|nr:hypothetical protein EVJ58_g284 [Rhodofomes roseus]
MVLSCHQDSAFGPASTCRNLDFTLYFEQTILSFTPDVIFIALALVRLAALSRTKSLLGAPGWPLVLSKLGSVLLTIASTAANLFFTLQTKDQGLIPVWVPSPALQLIASIPLGILVLMEHFRSPAPSMLVICYTLLKSLFCSVTLRTYLKTGLFGSAHPAAVVWTLVTTSYMLILCAELVEKRRLLRHKVLAPVSTSSFITRSLYLWLLPLMWTGRKKVLTIDDCGMIPDELSALSTRVALQDALSTTGTISFVTSDNSDTQGWALVGAFVCVYALIAITTSLYWEKVFDATVGLRGALVGVIYSKSLKLSSAASRSMGGGVASTYMSVDVERVCEGAQSFHELWACLVSVGLTIVIVYQQVTWPAFLPIVVTVLLIVATSFIGRSVGRRQNAWLAATDRRVKFISSMISNFLSIKWSCYEEILGAKVDKLRLEEMNEARRFYNGIVLSSSLSNTAGQQFPVLAASWASLQRIERFLLLDERQDEFLGGSEKLAQLYEGADGIELETRTPPPIVMKQAAFAWAPDTEPYLKDITLHCDEAKLYMCVGAVASGKSLLLLSILGETTATAGQYKKLSARCAYASQNALIIPGTIRDNILFGRAFQAERYSRVLDACALTLDIRGMPAGDGTWLGEKGRRLSGGQKQRIALARAVYADAPWTLLDDPLSALDAESESHIFHSLFGSGGILAHKAVLLVTHNDVPTEDIPEEESGEAALTKESLGFTPYRFYTRMVGRFNFVVAMFGIAMYAGMRLGIQVYLQQWADSNGAHPGAWAGGYAGFSLVSLMTIAFSFWQFAVLVAYRGSVEVHGEELNGLLHAAPSFFMSTPAGRIINRFSQDIFMIDFEWPINLLDALSIFVMLVGTLVFIFIPTPLLALSVFPLGAFYFMTTIFYLRTSKQLQHLEASSKSPLYSVFATTLSGLETIRALHVENYFQNQNDVHLNRSQTPYYYRFGGLRFLRTILAFMSFVIAVGLAALTIGLRRTVNPSSLGLALSNLTGLSNWLSFLLMSMAQVENGSVSISRILEIVNLPPEEDSTVYSTPDADWPSVGSVEFKAVSMRYQPELKPAVSNVSFHAFAGMKIGICGRSGSGKSSMILALFRGLSDSLVSGQISIDGVDIHSLSRSHLRKALSLVAQDPFVWHASIRSNLDPEEVHADAEIWVALDRVGMSDAVAGLPEKLDTVLEDGGSLSKGQMQLLCLSRVLLRRRKIVVLDEASSSLDLHTDEKIRAVIRTELSDCTVIAVAHRIATIVDFDVILVMDDGELVEHGTPEDLFARPDSRFARLAASQGIVRKQLQ